MSWDDKRVPQYTILVENKELSNEAFPVESIDVRLSASYRANDCSIGFVCRYDHKNSKIKDNLLRTLQPGKKIRVKLGYAHPEDVFLGYINTAFVEYTAEGVFLQISCLDARGMLMGNTSWETFENKSKAQIIEQILKTVKSYTDGIDVSLAGAADKENPETLKRQDYYSYVCSLAKLTGSSFCMIGTKLKFGKNVFMTATVQSKFVWGRDLLSFSRNADLSSQLGSVTVSGVEPDTLKEFSSTARASGSKTGAALSTGVKSKIKEVQSGLVRNQKEALTYAESLLRERSMQLVHGQARVIGDQKLEPGTKVNFSKLDPDLDGDYYITSIHHTFNANGFLTDIGFCRQNL